MRYALHIARLTLMLLMLADLSFARGEASFHHGPTSETESDGPLPAPEIRPMALDLAEADLAEMERRTGPAEAPERKLSAGTFKTHTGSSAVSYSPQKTSRKALKRQKRKPFRIFGGKRQSLALVLSIFLGILGIHRFYLGYTGIALIQMLTLGGLLVWFIVDAVRIGTGKLVPIRGPYTYRMGKQGDEESEQ